MSPLTERSPMSNDRMPCERAKSFSSRQTQRRSGMTLFELLAVVTILSVMALAVLPRISVSGQAAKEQLREQHIADLNRGLERYQFEFGQAAKELSDLESAGYYPDGVPVSPTNGAPYQIDATTGRIDRTK